MIAQDLIDSIRPKVGDTKATKWDNSRILELLNEGLEDMSKEAQIKIRDIAVPILPYQREVVIARDDVVNILTVEIPGHNIKLISFDKLISKDGWDSDIGTKITYVAWTKQNVKVLTLYPLLDETAMDTSALNTATGLVIDVPGIDRDSLYGIITSLDIAQNIITPDNIYNPDNLTGGLTSVSDNFIIAQIRYQAMPTRLLLITDTVDLDYSYKNTLIYYVSGMLLLDDSRVENVKKGELFIQKYNAELKTLKDRSGINSNKAETLEVEYRTGF